jgi:hypothetical protein
MNANFMANTFRYLSYNNPNQDTFRRLDCPLFFARPRKTRQTKRLVTTCRCGPGTQHPVPKPHSLRPRSQTHDPLRSASGFRNGHSVLFQECATLRSPKHGPRLRKLHSCFWRFSLSNFLEFKKVAFSEAKEHRYQICRKRLHCGVIGQNFFIICVSSRSEPIFGSR